MTTHYSHLLSQRFAKPSGYPSPALTSSPQRPTPYAKNSTVASAKSIPPASIPLPSTSPVSPYAMFFPCLSDWEIPPAHFQFRDLIDSHRPMPVWTASAFWQLLCPGRTHSAPYVRNFRPLSSRLPAPARTDISPGPVGKPSFLRDTDRRHKHEWIALHIVTSSPDSYTAAGPPFCTSVHFNAPCSLLCRP